MEHFSAWHWIVILAILVFVLVPYWRIVARTGHPGALALLMLVPLVNLGFIWWLAFSRWPRDRAE
jgi:hypothetical protein